MDPFTLLLLLGAGLFAVKAGGPAQPQRRLAATTSGTPTPPPASTPVEALPIRSTDPEPRPDPAPRSAFRSEAAYKANLAAAKGGGQYITLGADGVPRYFVPLLTPDQARAESARLGAESDNAAYDATLGGLRKAASTLPGLGVIISGQVVGDQPLTAAELLRNNANARTMAQIVVPQLDATPAEQKAALDPALLDEAGAGEANPIATRRQKP